MNGLLIIGEVGVISREVNVGNIILMKQIVQRRQIVNGQMELELVGVKKIGVWGKFVWD